MEIALDLVPGAGKIGILANVNNPTNVIHRREAEAAATRLRVNLLPVEVH